MMAPRTFLRTLALAIAALTVAAWPFGGAGAQSWPTKPVRVVVPYPPGGPTDVVARIYAAKLAEQIGQPVVIDNKGGASGQIGAQDVARAAPDGHTLMANASAAVIVPHVYANPLYDMGRDFAAVSLLASVPIVLIVPVSTTATSVRELVAGFKSKGTPVNFGSSSVAGAMHLAGESFGQMAGLPMQHIAYKGGGPAINALIAGEVPMSFESLPAAMPFIRNGQMKALALSAAKRTPALPDLPTMAEQGFPGFDLGSWYAMWAPAKTPPDIVKRINAELSRIAALPEIKAKFAELGTDPEAMTVEAFAAFEKSEGERWGGIARKAGVRLD